MCLTDRHYSSAHSLLSVYYGPDSVHSYFEADTCHAYLDIPTCALWVPDPQAFILLLTNHAPPFLGGWCLIGIIAASMSTADGAILAMGTVMSHNVLRQFVGWFPSLVTPENLLVMARITTIPFTIASTSIAAFYRSNSSTGGTGYLLIVAFDIVLANVVVPLFGCFYAKNPSPRAAFVAILGGAITRVVMEFTLPKDGFLLLPFDDPSFLDVGPAASSLPPVFIDTDGPVWDPATEPCDQKRFEDYTGVDSLSSVMVCLVLFLLIQWAEHMLGRPLFKFGGSEGYVKDTTEHPIKGAKKGQVGIPLAQLNQTVEEEASQDHGPRSSTVQFAASQPEVIGEEGEDAAAETEEAPAEADKE